MAIQPGSRVKVLVGHTPYVECGAEGVVEKLLDTDDVADFWSVRIGRETFAIPSTCLEEIESPDSEESFRLGPPEPRVLFRPDNHIVGKVYDLSQENMNRMIQEIERLQRLEKNMTPKRPRGFFEKAIVCSDPREEHDEDPEEPTEPRSGAV